MKEKDIQVQETQRVPIKMNSKKPTPRHSIIKMAKLRDRENIKSCKRETVTYLEGSFHRLSADFSTETLQAIRDWNEIFNVMKNKGLQTRLLYPARLYLNL